MVENFPPSPPKLNRVADSLVPPRTELSWVAPCNGILLNRPTPSTHYPTLLDFAQYLAESNLLIWKNYSNKKQRENNIFVLSAGGAGEGKLGAGPPLLEEDMGEKAMV